MSAPVSVALATGGLTAANELLFAPLSGKGTPWKDFNWRVIPATGIWALALTGLNSVAPKLALGLAVTGFLTALLSSFGSAAAPVINVASVLGYGPGKASGSKAS